MSEMLQAIKLFIDKHFRELPSLASWADKHPAVTTDCINWEVVGSWCVLLTLMLLLFVWLFSKHRIIDKLTKHLSWMTVVVWVLGVMVYIVGYYNCEVNGLAVVPRAVVSSFKMFVVANDLARVTPFLHNDATYMLCFSLVHFAAAFIAFLFIFKMIGYKIKSSWEILKHKLFLSKGRVVHLFWGVNEASCLLAEDIRRNHAKDTIILVDVDEESEDNVQKKLTLSSITNSITIKSSEVTRLEAIDALVDHCFNGPASLNDKGEIDIFGILHLNNVGDIVAKSKESYIYFLSNNEAQNIVGALNLQQDARLCAMSGNKPVIYVHARRDANNEVFDHYAQYDDKSKRMPIKIVDSAYLSIETLRQDDEALPVNCVDVDYATGLVKSPFTAMIVGFGDTGQEAFKFLYEYSAFISEDEHKNKVKSPFKCYAVDEKMDKLSGLVRAKMPAIGEDELTLISAAVDSAKFWDSIRDIIQELNYVVIALNNDAIGLTLAVNIFKYALKCRPVTHPLLKLMVRCYDSANEQRMVEVANSLNRSIGDRKIEIGLFGKEKDLYRCNTILSDATLAEAKEFNRVYENSSLSADKQWKVNFGETEIERLMKKKGMSRYHAIYDINRRIAQNISNSLHGRTKMILMGLEGADATDRLKRFNEYVATRKEYKTDYKCGDKSAEQLLLNMALVEHERWIASHKLMGYIYARKGDCVKKHHECICSWFDLADEMTQSYDCNVVDTTIKMRVQQMEAQSE